MLLRSLIGLLALVALWWAVLTAEAAKGIVILSRAAGQYQEVLQGFRGKFQGEMELLNLEGDVQAGKVELPLRHADIAVAFGPEAGMAAQFLPADVPVIYTMVLNPMTFPGRKSAGILMRLQENQQFSLLTSIFPECHSLTVLSNPQFSASEVSAARKVVGRYALDLQVLPLLTPETIGETLDKMSGMRMDAIWMVLDKTVMQPTVLKALTAFSLKQNIPLVGLSEYHVRAGALLAFVCDYVDLGTRSAELAQAWMNGQPPDEVYFPRKIITYVNSKVQKQMKLESLNLPDGTVKLEP